MCKSAEEGGQRCAAHTRGPYQAVIDGLLGVNKFSRSRLRNVRVPDGTPTNLQRVIDYASTKEGEAVVDAQIKQFEAERDIETAAWMKNGIKNGLVKREVAKEVAETVRKEKIRVKGKENGWASPRRPNLRLKPEASLAAKFPEVAERWHPTKNTLESAVGVTEDAATQVRPDQVEPFKNCDVWLTCPKGHTYIARLNNVTKPIDRGDGFPECDECKGRRGRQESLAVVQEDLRPVLAALGHDPDAWESLSPATRRLILDRMGLLKKAGGTEGFADSTKLSLIHGDLSLREVTEARNAEMIRGRVNEDLAIDDDADADKEIDLDRIPTPADDNTMPNGDTTQTRVDRLMSAAGTAGLLPDDAELADQILRETTEGLWNEIHDDPSKVGEIAAQVAADAAKNPGAAKAAEKFLAELRAVQAMPIPEGWSGAKRDPATGQMMEIEPLLSQKRFALMVEEKRTVTNWSGTGAGKTISGVLASRQVGAEETLVMCPPGPVAGQWAAEFRERFPDTEIRMGLPAVGEDLDATREAGKKRVWVVNYSAVSADSKEAAKALGPLADRLDCAILDEVHMAKSGDEKNQSQRRDVLDKFMDKAREQNPNLAVVGASATPVVNGLEEGKSLLRLVHGAEYVKGFGTKPTQRNASIAYTLMSRSGVRWRPSYSAQLQRDEVEVDISNNLDRVLDRVERMEAEDRSNGKTAKGRGTLRMEQALLPEKMPAIVKAVREAEGPTVVYSQFVEGMVDPIVDRMNAEGIPAARFTGKESMKDRAALIKRFQSGEIKVIVGSKPIATGVDGLQHVCKNMVVASAPWTAADDDQLVGRLHRKGQTENVKVRYIKTEATVEGSQWSFCQSRLNRIRYKRGLADAAVDGVMPDGRLGSSDKTTTAALTSLRTILGRPEDAVAEPLAA